MAFLDEADAAATELWDEELWGDLLAYIEAGVVVPIIGPACYPVDIDGQTMPIDILVAARKYFDSANAQIVVVGDRAQIGEQAALFGEVTEYDAHGVKR